MAKYNIIMENPNTGIIKKAPIGFSWTTLFFNFFPALLRGDVRGALIILLPTLVIPVIPNIVFAYIYNKIHIKNLLRKGFKVQSLGKLNIEAARKDTGINLPLLEKEHKP